MTLIADKILKLKKKIFIEKTSIDKNVININSKFTITEHFELFAESYDIFFIC